MLRRVIWLMAIWTSVLVLTTDTKILVEDPCIPNPCRNGGECKANFAGDSDFICSCVDDWSGTTCEKQPECIATSYVDRNLNDGELVPERLTKENCETKCRNTPGCMSFDYVQVTQSCYLNRDRLVEHYTLSCPDTSSEHEPEPSPVTAESTPKATTGAPTIQPKAAATTPQANPTTTTTTLKTTTSTTTTTTTTTIATTTEPKPATTTPKPTNPPIVTETPQTTLEPVCKVKLDLAFVVDGSSSICKGHTIGGSCPAWESNQKFISDLIQTMYIGPDLTRVAMVTFSDKSRVNWKLDTYSDKQSVAEQIDRLRFIMGETNTSGAIDTAVSQVFQPTEGDRPNVPNTIILITDGNPTIPGGKTGRKALDEAVDKAREANIKLLVVGVTPNVNEETLQRISAPPHKANVTYFIAQTYDSTDIIRSELHEMTCQSAVKAGKKN